MRLLVLLAALALAVPPAAGDYKDWRTGGSGDYAFIEDPEPLSLFDNDASPLVLRGVAGNDKPMPYLGSEDQWVALDGQGDGAPILVIAPNEKGTDIGNVWIQEDDGFTLDVYMRLFEDPPTVSPDAYRYTVNFTHVPTGVVYRMDATLAGGAYNATFHVQTVDFNGQLAAFCELAVPIQGGFSPQPGGGGYFTWRVEYGYLDVVTPPSPPDDDFCQEYVVHGAPAQVGQFTTGWRGRVYNSAGGVVNSHSIADESDGDVPWWQDHRLGPASVPAGPFNVQIYVMGQLVKTVATTIPCTPQCEWTADFSDVKLDEMLSIGCRYQFDVVYGQARDTLFLRGANCLDYEGTNMLVDNVYDEPQPDFEPPFDNPRPSAQDPGVPTTVDQDLDGRTATDGCEGFIGEDVHSDDDGRSDVCDLDWDGDGVLNGADNCPYTPNEHQLDSDHDGMGDACMDDADGDGVADYLDNCPGKANFFQFDMDGDGIGNECDDDADGDGVPFPMDKCPFDPRGWKNTDNPTNAAGKDLLCDHEDRDADGDGYDTVEELMAGTDPYDADSKPGEPVNAAKPQGSFASIGSMGLVSLGLVALLILLGVGLFFLLRPRQ